MCKIELSVNRLLLLAFTNRAHNLTKTKKGQELPSTQPPPKMVEMTEMSVGKQTCIYVWVEVYSSYVICNVWQCALKNVCNKA